MTFLEFLDAIGYDAVPYSGRGMGGEQCWAIDVTPAKFAADIIDYEGAEGIRLNPRS